MFSVTLSHFEKGLHEFLCMMDAIIIFEKNSFIFSFVGVVNRGWVRTFEEGAKKIKCQKMNVNFFTNKLR
jgi:hypothetical protein